MAKKERSSSSSSNDAAEDEIEFKYIVRLANTDIDGEYRLAYGLSQIKGVGFRVACTLADELGLSRTKKVGHLEDEEVEAIADHLENVADTLPDWMLNHRKDYDTGEDLHILGPDLDMKRRDDINMLKKIRSYRGIRHETGQKVRGQRTRANARTGLSLGVSRKARKKAQKALK